MRNFKSRCATAIIGGAIGVAALAPASASAQVGCGIGAADQIDGIGATFQADAQVGWGAIVNTTNPQPVPPVGVSPSGVSGAVQAQPGCSGLSVSYASLGSGAGRTAFGANGNLGVRNFNYEYGGVDEAPTSAQLAQANLGADQAAGGTGANGDGVLHTIPVAASAIAVDIQLPSGCSVSAANRRLSGAAIEGAFAGSASYDTWGELFPTISGTGCAARPFAKVVRSDSSGTTAQFKGYLNVYTSGTAWTTIGNTTWPTAVTAAAGNGGVATALLATAAADGGIAYTDLATARNNGFGHDGTATDRTFWVGVQRPNGGATNISPATSNSQAGTKGANCATVAFANTPADTTQSWSAVNGYNTQFGYPICALTYALAWDDFSDVGYTDSQEAQATADYLEYVTDATTGQTQLAARDYSRLSTVSPSNVATKAVTGAAAIGF